MVNRLRLSCAFCVQYIIVVKRSTHAFSEFVDENRLRMLELCSNLFFF